MAGANKEQPAGTRRNRMSFCKDGPAARCASRPTCTDTQERVAVWDAVADYVQEHLLVQKGVWIATFGTFDTINKDIRSEDGTVTLQWPVFHLSANLIATHHLKPRRESLPAHRKVEPLKYSKVAATASVTWQRAQMCIQSTVSLISGCLKNGENVAVVLKDIGVLHIDGLTFQMKFYRDFLEKLSGKEKFRRALLKAPWLLDMVASRAAPVASLALSGCLVVFPEFQMEFVPKPPPGRIYRKSSGSVPAEGKPKKEEALPPLVQECKKVRFAGTPTFIKRLSSASVDAGEFRKIRSLLRKDSSTFSLLPAICAVPEAQKQLLTCQLQGQEGSKGQEDRGRALGTKRVSFREEDLEAETFQGQESRLPLLHCDSVQLLRQRAKKSRPVHKQPEEVAAAASQSEASQPAESSADRAGVLPPINQVTQSPQRQPPNTNAPPRRKATHYPR
ncbi:uncharacterized protein LOC776874 isoform X1 [Gallus gallus]|uniref:uncharacterized protein LOC776874 isoform X1 n=1 Tax=Gallus gallus TaxID=9031 RepID=UPI001AE8AE2C|nr:uncharacterized protein LOC776874 isoform X1 [Gallus gallus]